MFNCKRQDIPLENMETFNIPDRLGGVLTKWAELLPSNLKTNRSR